MKVSEKGHVYHPANRQVEGAPEMLQQTLTFVNKEPGREHGGTTTQEIIRILIDRTRHCNNCLPHPNNERVIYHLRMALVLHEARALEQKTKKGDFMPEYLPIGEDGHFAVYESKNPGELDTPVLEPYRQEWEFECKHPRKETA